MRIGKITYANLFPIFYMLERKHDHSYEFVEGSPSELNRMIRKGRIDISPSSSIEYLRNPNLYRIIEGHSISSKGHIRSILFFSNKRIEDLRDETIYVSSQSETSVALLKIILQKFYKIHPPIKFSKRPEIDGSKAFLLIGDDALRYGADIRYKKEDNLYVYDLGQIWFDYTGLPFVFALWIARREVEEETLKRFINDLDRAKKIALESLQDIAKYSSLRGFMSEEEIVSYWNLIDYDLEESHKRGLYLFESYLREIDYDL